jgi:hypothetical protein
LERAGNTARFFISEREKRKMDKVYGGTPKDEDLCHTCSHSLIREDDCGNMFVRCNRFSLMVTRKTLTCTGYTNKSLPSIYDLQETAWVYIPRVGFKKYKKLTDEELEEFGG